MSRAEVAQLVEHSTENAGVVSSILSLGTLHTIENASSSFATRLRRFLFTRWMVLVSVPFQREAIHNFGEPAQHFAPRHW